MFKIPFICLVNHGGWGFVKKEEEYSSISADWHSDFQQVTNLSRSQFSQLYSKNFDLNSLLVSLVSWFFSLIHLWQLYILWLSQVLFMMGLVPLYSGLTTFVFGTIFCFMTENQSRQTKRKGHTKFCFLTKLITKGSNFRLHLSKYSY